MCGVSGPACWHDPLDDGLWERKLPRAIRSPDTGWRLAAMNARTAPNIFVREGDGISTLVVDGDWTAISIAGQSGRESGRERVCQYVKSAVVDESEQKKNEQSQRKH